jgi:hypothetical protein
MRPYVDDNVIEALDEYAVNATGKSGPSPSEYTQGSVPMDSLPSSWWNFFIGKLTKNVQRTAHGVQDIYAEMTAVLTEAGITPSATVHGQLLDGIKKVGGDQVKVITASASPDMNVVGYEYIIVGPTVTTGTVAITIPAASSVVLGSKFKGVRIGSVAGTGATVQVNASATSYMPQDPILLHPGEAMTFDLRSTSTGAFKWFMSSGGGGTYAGDVSKVRGSLARYSQQGTLRTADPTDPYDAINKQYYDAQVLGRQIWLAAVNTHAELPAPGDIPDYDPTANYLCRVMHDDGDPPQNGVWQLIAHSNEWTLFSDNADFIDEAELEEAISEEAEARDTAISEAIDTEIENRNNAITAAIEQEVLDRDEAITTAISSKQDTLIGSGTGQNLKTVGGVNLLGTGDISFPSGAISEFTYVVDSNEALTNWFNKVSGNNYRYILVGTSNYTYSGGPISSLQTTSHVVGYNQAITRSSATSSITIADGNALVGVFTAPLAMTGVRVQCTGPLSGSTMLKASDAWKQLNRCVFTHSSNARIKQYFLGDVTACIFYSVLQDISHYPGILDTERDRNPFVFGEIQNTSSIYIPTSTHISYCYFFMEASSNSATASGNGTIYVACPLNPAFFSSYDAPLFMHNNYIQIELNYTMTGAGIYSMYAIRNTGDIYAPVFIENNYINIYIYASSTRGTLYTTGGVGAVYGVQSTSVANNVAYLTIDVSSFSGTVAGFVACHGLRHNIIRSVSTGGNIYSVPFSNGSFITSMGNTTQVSAPTGTGVSASSANGWNST